jgi:predicted transcriptional regulator
MRNIEAHNQNSDDYVKIDKKSFDLLNDIIKILEKPLVSYDVATKNVTNRDLKDNVLEAVEVMRKNKFSYLPINDKGRFFGVFSAEVLFNYFYDTGETFLDNTITFKTLEDYLTISKHVNENFSFKSRKYLVSKIEDEFMSSYKDNKSLSAVFVTENGNKEEKIIGIITAWDVLNSYSK